MLSERAARLNSVQFRQVPIEHDQVWRTSRDRIQRTPSVGGNLDVVTVRV
jgi:hypothetical protein